MPLVVIDTSVALPATLSANSHPRKLLVMLAFGAQRYRAEHLRVEADALRETARRERGEFRGLAALERSIERAQRGAARLADRLPYEAPDDWVAAGFAALFDEFARKLVEVGPYINPRVRDEDVAGLRKQFEAVCVAGPPPFDLSEVPSLTRDPSDDPIVYGALLCDADYLVTDDKDIIPDGEMCEYSSGEHRLYAVRFGRFANECFQNGGFPWSEVDGSWLREAWGPGDDVHLP